MNAPAHRITLPHFCLIFIDIPSKLFCNFVILSNRAQTNRNLAKPTQSKSDHFTALSNKATHAKKHFNTSGLKKIITASDMNTPSAVKDYFLFQSKMQVMIPFTPGFLASDKVKGKTFCATLSSAVCVYEAIKSNNPR